MYRATEKILIFVPRRLTHLPTLTFCGLSFKLCSQATTNNIEITTIDNLLHD